MLCYNKQTDCAMTLLCLRDDEADLSAVTPLLVASYMLCYTPFAVSEVIYALTHYEITKATERTHTHFSTPLKCLCFILAIHQSDDPAG